VWSWGVFGAWRMCEAEGSTRSRMHGRGRAPVCVRAARVCAGAGAYEQGDRRVCGPVGVCGCAVHMCGAHCGVCVVGPAGRPGQWPARVCVHAVRACWCMQAGCAAAGRHTCRGRARRCTCATVPCALRPVWRICAVSGPAFACAVCTWVCLRPGTHARARADAVSGGRWPRSACALSHHVAAQLVHRRRGCWG
jgi:hypothetical protein